jgi:hypothetical protein
MIMAMLAYMVIKVAVSKLCILLYDKYPDVDWIKDLGVWAHEEEYIWNLRYANAKLFLESYYDLVLCVALGMSAFFGCKNFEEFTQFWTTFEDVLCSSLTILFFILVIAFPLYGYAKIRANQDHLTEPDFKDKFAVYIEDINMDSYYSSMYTILFMARKLIMISVFVLLNKYIYF